MGPLFFLFSPAFTGVGHAGAPTLPEPDYRNRLRRITETGLGVYDVFLAVSLLSLSVCPAIYPLLIRPFELTRLLLGVK